MKFHFSLTLAALLISASTSAADDHPDISGVWVAFASNPSFIGAVSAPETDQGKAMVEEYFAQFENHVEPGAWCVPPGIPYTMMTQVSYPVEIVQTENRITMLLEYDMQVRRIFMDGRTQPDDYPPTRVGYSTGRWEENTLVVKTGLLSEDLDNRWPRTEQTSVSERIYLSTFEQEAVESTGFVSTIADPVSNDVLVLEYTVIDPVLFNSPKQVTMYYQRMTDDIFLEYDCPAGNWREALKTANP